MTSPPQRHAQLYFEDGNAIFLVENTLFKLHRSFLCRDSDSVFKSLFSIPVPRVGQEGKGQGSNDSDPIPIPDSDEETFATLVKAAYVLRVGVAHDEIIRLFGTPVVLISDWIAFFKLADRFCMDSLIQVGVTAIKSFNLDEMSPSLAEAAKCFELARDHVDVFTEEYQNQVFQHLVDRVTPLCAAEMKFLGWEMSARVAQSRETGRGRHFNPSMPQYRTQAPLGALSVTPSSFYAADDGLFE